MHQNIILYKVFPPFNLLIYATKEYLIFHKNSPLLQVLKRQIKYMNQNILQSTLSCVKIKVFQLSASTEKRIKYYIKRKAIDFLTRIIKKINFNNELQLLRFYIYP